MFALDFTEEIVLFSLKLESGLAQGQNKAISCSGLPCAMNPGRLLTKHIWNVRVLLHLKSRRHLTGMLRISWRLSASQLLGFFLVKLSQVVLKGQEGGEQKWSLPPPIADNQVLLW